MKNAHNFQDDLVHYIISVCMASLHPSDITCAWYDMLQKLLNYLGELLLTLLIFCEVVLH